MATALTDLDARVEYVFVDDGSTDATVLEIQACMKDGPKIQLLVLSRNFGKDAALAAGLAHATGRAAIPIDVDLQDSPEVIPEMVQKWRDGAKVVNARRADRATDSWFKRVSAQLYYKVFNAVADHPIPANVGDFRLIDRQVIDILNTMSEKARFNKDLLVGSDSIAPRSHLNVSPATTGRQNGRSGSYGTLGSTGFSGHPPHHCACGATLDFALRWHHLSMRVTSWSARRFLGSIRQAMPRPL